MKKFPFHRRIVLVLGIGVALAIAIAMWTARFEAGGTGAVEVEESLPPAPTFTNLLRQSASALYHTADIIVSTPALTEE